jgi:hypothetical protein
MFAERVGAPAVGGDDAEGAGVIDEDAEGFVALGGGLEDADGVGEEAAHRNAYRPGRSPF